MRLVYKDKESDKTSLSHIVKVLVVRSTFITHVINKYKGLTYETISRECNTDHPDKRLINELKLYVCGNYNCLEADVELDDNQFIRPFQNSSAKMFYVEITFKDKLTINKMKLKYPDIMEEIGVKQCL